MTGKNRQSDFGFSLMAIEFAVRDWFKPPVKILREAGLREGATVLDFGCGPGGFSIAAARIVGHSGTVYALDIHPLAFDFVRKKAEAAKLDNVKIVEEHELRTIPSSSCDMVLVYDVLHDLDEPEPYLREFHRLLKTNGVLSVSDHHLKEAEIVGAITKHRLYHAPRKLRHSYVFNKVNNA